MSYRVAIVSQNLCLGGGLTTMVKFLHRVLSESGHYQPDLFSLSTSASDSASVSLRSLRTWKRGIEAQPSMYDGLGQTHIGAWFSELEFQRYKPRSILTTLLQEYDLVQCVVGAPSLAYATLDTEQPVLVWTATTVWPDRVSRVRHASLKQQTWMMLMTPLAQYYERCALRKAQAVLALSKYTQDAVQPFVTSGRVELAPCGVDTDLFRPANYATRDYIISVARFSDARKNVTLLLETYAKLHHKMPSLPDLYLVGELPTESAQAILKKLGIDGKVHLLGPQNGETLAELYRNALFFVFSSDEEGLGIVILEAMASGLAVVSTACGGPETAVINGETGFLTPVGDSDALAAAMQKLLEDQTLCRRMGQAGRQLAEERFSIAVTGKVFLDKYDELLARRK